MDTLEYRAAKENFAGRDSRGHESLDVRRYQKGFAGNGVPWHTKYSMGTTPAINTKLTPKEMAERLSYGICVLEDPRGGNMCRSDIYEAVAALAEAGGFRSKKVRALLGKRLDQMRQENVATSYQDLKSFADRCMEAAEV